MGKRRLLVLSLLVTVFLVIASSTIACPKFEPTLPPPAVFTLSNLSINPAEVKPGDKVTISAEVRNAGDSAGSYTVELKVNDVIEARQLVTLAAKTNQLVTFTLSKDTPGTYKVSLAGLSGKFTVIKPVSPAAFTFANFSISPAEVKPGDKVTISVEVRNIGGSKGSYTVKLKVNDVAEATQLITLAAKESQLVSFTLSKDLPGTYKVNLAELSGKFVVTAPASAVRTATLTDEQATRLLVRAISIGKVEFMPGNIIRLSWPPLLHLSLPIDVSEGKLYFKANVPEWVYRELHMIHYYTKFDNGRLFLIALPCWFDPRKEIAPDVDKLPYVISIVTRKGEATITYRWP